jgi:ABC-2 type transport system permease protein
MSNGRLWAAYFNEIHIEFLKSLRTPAFAVPTLFFPVMFYVLFGVFLGAMRGNADMAEQAFATYGVFGAMGPGLFGFGVSIAIEREQGLLTLKQALPQPPGAYLLARAVMAMLFVAIISILLTAMALTLGEVPLSAGQVVQLFLIDVFGALPFCAMGLYLGALVSGQASPAIINCVFLPMAFLSGLFLPLQLLPKFLQDIAPVFPAYHLAQMALETVGAPSKGAFWTHAGVLAGVTLGFFLLAVRRMHGSGFRPLGANPRRTLVVAAVVTAVLLTLMFSGVLGGKPAITDATAAATDAASTTGTPASNNEPAPGVAAPATVLVAGFDQGSAKTAYGIGFDAAGDAMRGGNSTASQKIVAGGAGGSAGALEVSGEIGNGIQYPFAGSMFFPEGPPMDGLMDYSAKKTLSFFARGDGGKYTLMVISGTNTSAIPLMYRFEAGPEWREVRLDIAEYGAADFKRVRAIGFGSMGPVGPFRFQIDDLKFE